MRKRKVRSATFYRIMHLAQKIAVVLARKTRHEVLGSALARCPVA
jgi:hypothetical protein